MSNDAMEELQYLHEADTEPIAGYRLLEPLGRGGFGEVWKCEAPGGLLKAIKFVTGGLQALDDNAPADEELRAIQRVKTVRHPFILSMERVEVVEGELVIVSELAECSLADRLTQRRGEGYAGLPRDQLLGYLREAAEALDVMHIRHGLQHLDIKPQNLFLISNHVKVGDFGLVQSLSGGGGTTVSLGAITPLYASPEVFQGRISPHSDQYSLAIVFQELLTGSLPFTGKNSRQLLMQHLQGEANLSGLSDADRRVIQRALSKDPAARFPSCADLVQALTSGHPDDADATVVVLPLPAPPADTDTRKTPAVKTLKTRAQGSVRPPVLPAGVAEKLTIVDLISRSPLSEVWQATTGEGEPRIVKVLFGCPGPEDEGIAQLTALDHPALLRLEVLRHTPGKLILASRPGECSLRDLVGDGKSIHRADLLGWLRDAAEALHELSCEFGLYHLTLNPRNLVLEYDRLKLADFGLAQLVWLRAGQAINSLAGRYGAPELATGKPGPASDQYSLALIYHELVVGELPRFSTGRGEWDLSRLEEQDRPVVARALSQDSRRRWDNLLDLILALDRSPSDTVTLGTSDGPTHGAPTTQRMPRPDDVTSLQMRFGTNLVAGQIRERLEAFRKQWNARVIVERGTSVCYHVQTPRSLWQRWSGQEPGLEVSLDISDPEVNAPAGVQVRSEVRLDIRPVSCAREAAAELVRVAGPLLVESVRHTLQGPSRSRQQERQVWPFPLQLQPILEGGGLGPAIECQGKDISQNGIGFYLSGEVPSSQVLLHLPESPQTSRMDLPARIVRVQAFGDGWVEVGAVLLPPDELPEDEPLEDDPGSA